MSTITADDEARQRLGFLERLGALRSSADVAELRKELADKIGIAPGSAENLRRGRTKGVRQWIADRIGSAFVSGLAREMRMQTHDLERAIQSGVRPGSSEILEIQTTIAALQKMIAELS